MLSNLFGVVTHQFGFPKLHIAIDSTFKEIVVVVIITKGFNVEQMVTVLVLLFLASHACDVQLAGVVVDLVLAWRSTFQESDGVVFGGHVVEGRVSGGA